MCIGTYKKTNKTLYLLLIYIVSYNIITQYNLQNVYNELWLYS